jgi:hypothetical protein
MPKPTYGRQPADFEGDRWGDSDSSAVYHSTEEDLYHSAEEDVYHSAQEDIFHSAPEYLNHSDEEDLYHSAQESLSAYHPALEHQPASYSSTDEYESQRYVI